MRKADRFWDKIAERYAGKPVPDEAAYRTKLEVTREYFRQDMQVMEFGCGTGSTAIAQAPFVKHILAIDISSKMIEIARAKAAESGIDNVEFKQATIEELGAESQPFDAVMGHSILHLVEDRDDTIARVYRMLKPGGVFVSNTACIGDKMKFFKLIGPVGRFLGLMPLVRVFTTRQLLDSLKKAGFRIDHQWKPVNAMSLFVVATKQG